LVLRQKPVKPEETEVVEDEMHKETTTKMAQEELNIAEYTRHQNSRKRGKRKKRKDQKQKQKQKQDRRELVPIQKNKTGTRTIQSRKGLPFLATRRWNFYRTPSPSQTPCPAYTTRKVCADFPRYLHPLSATNAASHPSSGTPPVVPVRMWVRTGWG
jgi:hypothetical protein